MRLLTRIIMSKQEFQIGESFQYGLLLLKCIENPDKEEKTPCRNCYFSNLPCDNMIDSTGACEPERRKDGRNVIFIETTINE